MIAKSTQYERQNIYEVMWFWIDGPACNQINYILVDAKLPSGIVNLRIVTAILWLNPNWKQEHQHQKLSKMKEGKDLEHDEDDELEET